MSVMSNFDSLDEIRRRYGWLAALRLIVSRGLKKFLRLEMNELVSLTEARLSADTPADAEFTYRFLEVDEVVKLVNAPDYELAPEFSSRIRQDMIFALVRLMRLGEWSITVGTRFHQSKGGTMWACRFRFQPTRHTCTMPLRTPVFAGGIYTPPP